MDILIGFLKMLAYGIGSLVAVIFVVAIVGMAVLFWEYINPRYLWCRLFHKLSPCKFWELNPFGMGGGYYKYFLQCEKCAFSLRISQEKFDRLTANEEETKC